MRTFMKRMLYKTDELRPGVARPLDGLPLTRHRTMRGCAGGHSEHELQDLALFDWLSDVVVMLKHHSEEACERPSVFYSSV